MPNLPPDCASEGTQEPFVVIPVSLIEYVRERNLSGNQYELWLYLFALDPYGDRFVEMPSPEEIAKTLKCSYRTVERAVQRLKDCDLFDFKIEAWKACNIRGRAYFGDFSPDKGIQMRTKRSKCPNPDKIVGNGISVSEEKKERSPEPAPGANSQNGQCTNNRTNRLVRKNIGAGSTGNEQGGDLVQEAIALVVSAGLRPNQTIQKVIAELAERSPETVLRTVSNAITAVEEQRQQGTVRNPSGLLVAALRRGFTSNEEKKKARRRKGESQQELVSAAIPPPDKHALEVAIDSALLRGDRDWALSRLRQVWADGWQDLAEEMILLRKRDWGFSITREGVMDDGKP